MLKKYYDILGVDANATEEALKRAYREKAKQLHPDKNKAENAHEQFVLLAEAYEYLNNLKTGKIKEKSPVLTQEEFLKQQLQKARERAARQAKMEYEEFLKSDAYKSLSSITTIGEHLAFFFAIFMFLVLPVGAVLNYGSKGFLASLLIIAVTLPISIVGIRKSTVINYGKLVESITHIIQTKGFLVALISFLNVFTFLQIGLQTLISIYVLAAVFVIPVITAILVINFFTKISGFRAGFIPLCLVPFIFNLLFVANFVFSNNPVQETYPFHKELQPSRAGWQESTYIILENNTYSNYQGIRAFWDYEKMIQKSRITYTFKEGLFGVRVMTDYRFE